MDNASRTVQALQPVAKAAGTLLRGGEGHSQFVLVCKVFVVWKVKEEQQQYAHNCEKRTPDARGCYIFTRSSTKEKKFGRSFSVYTLGAPAPDTSLAACGSN